MNLVEKISNAIEEPLKARGYDLVRINFVPTKKRTVLTIDVDKFDGSAVTIDDCVAVNNLVSAILDVEDFIEGSYNLEVSSPGEFRPIRKVEDYVRFCGSYAKLRLFESPEGRLNISGTLLKVGDSIDDSSEDVRIHIKDELSNEILEICYKNIKDAKVKRELKKG